MNTVSCKNDQDEFTKEELSYLEEGGVVWVSEEEFDKLTEQYEEICIEVNDEEKDLYFSFNGIVIEE